MIIITVLESVTWLAVMGSVGHWLIPQTLLDTTGVGGGPVHNRPAQLSQQLWQVKNRPSRPKPWSLCCDPNKPPNIFTGLQCQCTIIVGVYSMTGFQVSFRQIFVQCGLTTDFIYEILISCDTNCVITDLYFCFYVSTSFYSTASLTSYCFH